MKQKSEQTHINLPINNKINDDLSKVTVGLLKKQVDQLVINYNKLAKTLNRPTIDETHTHSV